ncbi:M23 family metallopeptidase [Alloacidobacterium dinghuense]|uniref:M23 family metallopeptidase n=1 Tax=Alloacidobacterium dinghuense TaxID=2763107 RepID=A0A7G8BFQ4_9BACT|nr:M23 family metallopeptidase [Alloacidobacterium dinghuense]QNI31374.1 M23 family metallopeptidase [Alloacidobacterium dinghuense]
MPKIRALLCTALMLTAIAFHLNAGHSETTQDLMPLLLTVHDAPVPFTGSDGHVHLVYELWMANFSSGEADIEKVEVLGDGLVLQTLDRNATASRLQPAGKRESAGAITGGAQSLLFLDVILPAGASIPKQLTHRVQAHYAAAPPGHQDFSETGGATTVDRREVAQIGPPLSGDSYISADSCCDATRHTRAALPVNGNVYVAQRYAVDWEQLDANNRIYAGPREELKSYTIFGKHVLAVADAVVAVVVKGLPEQAPGKYPTDLPLDQADGNAIILDLGQHRYALYAHMQSESIHVNRGDKVKLGQVIGLVGDSGNSVAPHLHFQLMDGELSLASNGLPYEIKDFKVTGQTPGTKAFDEAEENGTPLAITPITPPHEVKKALPLDQLIISFAQH